MDFQIKAPFEPAGDQPQAIEKLAAGVEKGLRTQVLLGATGTGKTYTIAQVINKVRKPTLVIAHNKTLAAQLASELKAFFPDNAVNILFPTTITTSRRPIFPNPTPILKRMRPSMTKSISCATPRPAPSSSARMSSSWPASAVFMAWVRRRSTMIWCCPCA